MPPARMRFIVASLVATSLGILLLVGGHAVSVDRFEWIRALLLNLGSVLVASVAIGLFWEFWGRSAFLADVLDRVQVSEQLHRSGVVLVTNQYLHDVSWSSHLNGATHVDLLFAYARTWRNAHYSELLGLLSRPSARVRVVLPDVDDNATIAELGRRYGYSADELKELIGEALTFFSTLHEPGSGCNLQVWFHRSSQVYSYYRFDGVGILGLYRQAGGRGEVPVFEFRQGGNLYQMLKDDFEDVVSEARLVYPESQVRQS